MKSKALKETTRQLYIYYLLRESMLMNPKELMQLTGITNRRMLQRDFEDLRNSGLYNPVFFKRIDEDGETYSSYYSEDTSFDESSTGNKRAHLLRLKRLGTLIFEFPTTDRWEYEEYQYALKEYNELADRAKEDPGITREDLVDAKESVDLYAGFIKQNNLKQIYYELFPEEDERTRQRDFEEINRIPGFSLYYDFKLMTFIYFIEPDE